MVRIGATAQTEAKSVNWYAPSRPTSTNKQHRTEAQKQDPNQPETARNVQRAPVQWKEGSYSAQQPGTQCNKQPETAIRREIKTQAAHRARSIHGGAGQPPAPERQHGTRLLPTLMPHQQYNTCFAVKPMLSQA